MQRSDSKLRVVIFDFDHTLAVGDIHKALAGADQAGAFCVLKPHSKSELGQITRIAELDRTENLRAKGGFATVVLGGRQRVARIVQLCQDLRSTEPPTSLLVCTNGLVGPVKKVLGDLDLLRHFDGFYGNIGTEFGETPYDRGVAAVPTGQYTRDMMGQAHEALVGPIISSISKVMSQHCLRQEEVVFVGHELEQIQRSSNVCQTLWVQNANGMDEEHFNTLRELACLGRATNPLSAKDVERLCGGTGKSADHQQFHDGSNSTDGSIPEGCTTPSSDRSRERQQDSGLGAEQLAVKLDKQEARVDKKEGCSVM